MKHPLTPQQLRAREMVKNVHPTYDRATVEFDRIANGTGILCIECKACGRRPRKELAQARGVER